MSEPSPESTPRPPSGSDELFALVYQDLRRLAEVMFRSEPDGHTLQPTAVVHEAWMRIRDQDGPAGLDGKKHFYLLAARAMRQMLVDYARGRRAEKRGQAQQRVTLDVDIAVASGPEIDVLALDSALTKLAALYDRQARVAEMRFLTGLEIEEIAEALEISEKTVRRDWRFARAWLKDELA